MQVVYNKLWLAELHNIVDSPKIALQPKRKWRRLVHYILNGIILWAKCCILFQISMTYDKMFALVLSMVCFPNRRHVIPWINENDNTIKKRRVHISSTIQKHVSSGLSYFILFPGWFLIWPPGKISFADDSYWLYYFQYMFVHISSIGLSIQLCSFSFLYNLGKRPVIAISYKNMF